MGIWGRPTASESDSVLAKDHVSDVRFLLQGPSRAPKSDQTLPTCTHVFCKSISSWVTTGVVKCTAVWRSSSSWNMEQGFDGWVRNRFHVESSDIPDIASHIDPNLFEPDWTLPSGVDDLFSWLTSNQDVPMDQAVPHAPAVADTAADAAAGLQAAAAAGQMHAGQQQQALPAQHHVSGWQLAYLQQAMKQAPDTQMTMPAQLQQQAMFPACAGYPAPAQLPAAGAAYSAGAAYPADFAAPQQQQLQQQFGSHSFQDAYNARMQYGGAAAAAAADAGLGSMQPLQHAGSSGRSSHSSGSTKQKGSRAVATKQQGGGQRKPRKITDAQRAAHKRFRVRRKEQVC